MKNVKNTTKTILFASLIVAMILPFSSMNYADAQLEEVNGMDKTNEILQHKKLIDEEVVVIKNLWDNIDSLTNQLEELKTDSTSISQQGVQRLETALDESKTKFDDLVVKRNQENNIPDAQIGQMKLLKGDFVEKLVASDILEYVTGVGIDLQTKEIQVGLDNTKLNTKTAVAISKQIGELMPKDAKWHYVLDERVVAEVCNQQICTPTIGGNHINIDGSDCSVGFKARIGSTYGFVTSGHCADSDVGKTVFNANTAAIGTVYSESRYSGTDCDCAFVDDSVSTNPKVWDGVLLTLTGYTSTSNQQNDIIFKSGYAGGVDIGIVSAISQTNFSLPWGWTDELVKATYSSTGGDSGGTIYVGTSLYGVHFGSAWGYALYSPVDEAISVLGVTPVF